MVCPGTAAGSGDEGAWEDPGDSGGQGAVVVCASHEFETEGCRITGKVYLSSSIPFREHQTPNSLDAKHLGPIDGRCQFRDLEGVRT